METLTPEGAIVLKALEVHRLHLEKHDCKQCLNTYETVLNSITEWVKSQKEESDNEQEEKARTTQKGQILKERRLHNDSEKEAEDIFE